MTEQQHRATAEQWKFTERQATQRNHTAQLLLELRDRIAALEAAANLRQQDEDAELAIDEAESDRRFRDCLAVIDNATPEQIQAAANSKPTPNSRQIRSSAEGAPAGGLVELVALAICRCDDLSSWREEAINWSPEARAAILAVANWVVLQNTDSGRLFACWLQEEAERG